MSEIREARKRFPYGRDADNLKEISRETGLSERAASECLNILRDDSEGDVVELDAAIRLIRQP